MSFADATSWRAGHRRRGFIVVSVRLCSGASDFTRIGAGSGSFASSSGFAALRIAGERAITVDEEGLPGRRHFRRRSLVCEICGLRRRSSKVMGAGEDIGRKAVAGWSGSGARLPRWTRGVRGGLAVFPVTQIADHGQRDHGDRGNQVLLVNARSQGIILVQRGKGRGIDSAPGSRVWKCAGNRNNIGLRMQRFGFNNPVPCFGWSLFCRVLEQQRTQLPMRKQSL